MNIEKFNVRVKVRNKIMAYVRFKPVCNCGYIFEDFIYTPSQKEVRMDAEREIIGVIERCADCFLPRHCPNCGERITNLSIPVFPRVGEIIYKEGGNDIL